MYTMLGTRPDIAFAVSYCSRFLAKPTKAYRTAVRRSMRFLKSTTACVLSTGEKSSPQPASPTLTGPAIAKLEDQHPATYPTLEAALLVGHPSDNHQLLSSC